MNFTFSLKQIGSDCTELTLIGGINEDFNHETLPEIKKSQVIFNLQQIVQINSIGIRNFFLYKDKIPKATSIVYDLCPPIFIYQLNMVFGLMDERTFVRSFYAPYFNEVLNKEKLILLRPDQIQNFTVPNINEDGGNWEFDGLPEKYLSFLKGPK